MSWFSSVGAAEFALANAVPMMPRMARSIRVAIPSVKLIFFVCESFIRRNLADVGMVQCINALADKVQKQDVLCTQ